MNQTDHFQALLADYVLDLLPAAERRRVDDHVRHCADCRAALRRERAVGALVRETVQAAAPVRLAHWQPARPAPRPQPSPFGRLAPALVTLLLGLGLLLGSGRLPMSQAGYGPLSRVVHATAAPTETATQTHTPTATLAAVLPSPDTPTPQTTPSP
jgi:anti-sigma factor RsiW